MTKRKIITLTLTQTCNLACVYCYEENKTGNRMSLETAKAILDRELNDDRFDEYQIDLFGGEPFMEFELIKQIFEYTVTTYPKKLLVFAITTNGTLVHGSVQEWLTRYSSMVCCALSMDGSKQMHDINRCNSFDQIDVDFFRNTWPKQPMKMTVSQDTLPYLAEGIRFMHENDYPFSVNLALDIDWSDPDNEAILERELMKLVEFYMEHPDYPLCSFFDVPIYKLTLPPEIADDSVRQCGAGNEMITYDVDGESYACQFFMPLSIGPERAKISQSMEYPETVLPTEFEEPCKSCMALPVCHTCYGANFAATGNIFKKDMNWCKLQKIIFKAAAYFQAQKIENGTFECDEAKKPYVLRAILKLLNEFD